MQRARRKRVGRFAVGLAALAMLVATQAQAGEARWSYLLRAGLAGWDKAGHAAWTVSGLDLIGKAKRDGGWLLLDRGYQDFTFRASFRCKDCAGGVVVRAAAAGADLSGIYLPLGGADLGKLLRVRLSGADRRITAAAQMPEPLPGPPIGKIDEGACRPMSCAGIRDAHGGAPLALKPPPGAPTIAVSADGWNTLEIVMRGDVMTASINGQRLPAARMDHAPLFGRIGLYVGPSSEIRFKDVMIEDRLQRPSGFAAPYTAPDFAMRQLNDAFYAEGASIGDINRDGHPDLVAGPFYFLGPDFRVAREIYPPETANIAAPQGGLPDGPGVPGMGMSAPGALLPGARVPAVAQGNYSSSFQSWVHDFNGDGWPDVLAVLGLGGKPTFSAHLFLNPGTESRSWDNYEVASIVADEVDDLVDIDGDGKVELVMRRATSPSWGDAEVGLLRPDPADPTKPWKFTPISEKATWRGHGAGVGDIDGDGRLDIVNNEGWWRQPAPGVGGLWTYHKQLFRADDAVCGFICGGAQMGVYDVDGDGLTDVVTSLAAHGAGLAWYRQRRDAQGGISWEKHLIMGDPATPLAERGAWEETDKRVAFTELHALGFADMNGDGLQDIVTGKRWWSHGPRSEENDNDDPPVLYWFELRRDAGKVAWVPHLIDNRSGVGTQIGVGDVDGDGRPDVLVTARKGTFLFTNRINR